MSLAMAKTVGGESMGIRDGTDRSPALILMFVTAGRRIYPLYDCMNGLTVQGISLRRTILIRM